MASSGSFNTTGYQGRYLQFSWSIKNSLENRIETNKTVISWTLKGAGVAQSGWYETRNIDLKIAGTTVYSFPQSQGHVKLYNGTVVASGEFTFTHNSAGEAAFSASAEAGIYYYAVNCSGSGSFNLDTIPRGSTLTVAAGTLGTAQTLIINRASSSFKHRIQYFCGNTSGYAAGSASAYTTSTSISWAPPLSLAAQNTTGTSVSIRFVLGTYTSDGSLVGYANYTHTFAIPASVKPSCTMTLEDTTGIDKIYGSPVQGLSKIKVKVTATTAQGSAISAYSVTANGTSYSAAEITTGVLRNSGASPVTATVRDGRGRTGSASYTMQVQAYTAPRITALAVHRCDANGTRNDQGLYIQAVFSAAISSLSSKNSAEYSLRYKKSTATSWTAANLSDLDGAYTVTDRSYIFSADESASYDVEVTATDSHSTTTRATSASTAFSLMDWHPSGTGLRFGGVAEKANTMRVSLDAEFDHSVSILGNRQCYSTPGVSGTAGYILMARIIITAANADTPITFVFGRRQAETPMSVHVQLRNSTTASSMLQSISYEGTNYGAFLVPVGTLTWELYVQKGSTYDTIVLLDWYTSKTMESRVEVSFPGTLVSAVPEPFHRATPAKIQSILDFIYPVGSIYLAYNHINPGTLFGGTWVRIQNRFLWAVGSDGTIGQTGGEQTVTLTPQQLPEHSHMLTIANTTPGSVTATNTVRYNNDSSSYVGTARTAVTGDSAPHNNMPPYIQVSAWRRTA